MKSIKDLLNTSQDKNIYQKLNFLINSDADKNLLEKQDTSNKEFKVGLITIIIIILIISSTAYYFLVFQPQMTELQEHKNSKINQLNTILPDSTDHNANKQAILSQINSASTKESVDSIDIYAQTKPILISQLSDDINQYKDKYDRVIIKDDNSSKIFSSDEAKKYIKTLDSTKLSTIAVSNVDTIIVPLNLNRKQSASGFITQGDTVDIYKINNDYQNTPDYQPNYTEQNTNLSNESSNNTYMETYSSAQNNSSLIVGGATVISMLRSKDSAVVESDIELNQYPKSRNYSQISKTDIQEVIEAKASGTLDESKLKILYQDYGYNLSKYERISNIGDLESEYIIMVEVPRESVDELLNNMDSLILTIPTSDAPSWVKIK